jgi:AmiR/NasT family two-component response regulator
MERFRLQRADAYARLRRYSRTERRKLVELATELLASTEELSRTMRAIGSGLEEN